MFRLVISTLLLSSTLIAPVMAAPSGQTGVIRFEGYVYDDTAIRDQAALVNAYSTQLSEKQNEHTQVDFAQLFNSDRLIATHYQQSGKTILDVSFI